MPFDDLTEHLEEAFGAEPWEAQVDHDFARRVVNQARCRANYTPAATTTSPCRKCGAPATGRVFCSDACARRAKQDAKNAWKARAKPAPVTVPCANARCETRFLKVGKQKFCAARCMQITKSRRWREKRAT